MYFSTKPELGNVFLYTDYIFLDSAERRRFSQVQHEYLIEQVQRKQANVSNGTTQSNIKFKFNHPVKEIVWTVQPKVHRNKNYSHHAVVVNTSTTQMPGITVIYRNT